jgi:hypothetical protein
MEVAGTWHYNTPVSVIAESGSHYVSVESQPPL